MEAFTLAAFALYGLAFGSFLTVVIYRLPRGESVVAPRSGCPTCGSAISAKDNIPVVSYLLLRGRCRGCASHISAEYPATEALTGGLFVVAALTVPSAPVATMVALFFGVMVAAGAIDLHHRIIPNRLTYPATALAAAFVVVLAAAGRPVSVLGAAIGFAAFGGSLLVVALVSGGMGMGDVKLAALIGLVLGSLGIHYVAVAAAAAVLFGGIGGLIALARGRDRRSTIPFGPYLALGAGVAVIVGSPVASWYAQLAH